jgi:hypothetical protein
MLLDEKSSCSSKLTTFPRRTPMSNYPDHEEIPFEEPNPNSVPNEQPEQENPDGYSGNDPEVDPDPDPDADPDQSGTDEM